MRIALRSGLLILLLLELFASSPVRRAAAAPAGPGAPGRGGERSIHEALPITEQALLQPDRPAESHHFGASVAVSGDTAVIGAPDDGDGAAYVFTRTSNGWQQQTVLRASDAVNDAGFGLSVAMDGHTIVVGAPGASAAYVFTHIGGAWMEQTRLRVGPVWEQISFGQSVAIDGDIVVIGAPRQDNVDENIHDSGVVYVFTRANGSWSQTGKIRQLRDWSDRFFGSQVAIDGTTIAVSAFRSDVNTNPNYLGDLVFVYVLWNETWALQDMLHPAAAVPGDQYGAALALSGDTIVVGAPYSAVAPHAGRAFVYTRSARDWTLTATLQAVNAAGRDSFGRSVAVSGDTILVGAPWADGASPLNGSQAGAMYMFVQVHGTWTERVILRPASSRQGDEFGGSVALSGDTIMAGAPGFIDRTTQAISAGAAMIWSRQGMIRPASVEAGDAFGASTAIAGDTMVIGAPADDGPTNATPDAGAVYVFARAGGAWSQQAILRASNGEALDGFGASVAVDGTTIVVGAPDEDGPTNATWSVGTVYVFTRTDAGWAEQAILRPSRADRLDAFGRSVAVAGDTVVVGIPGLDRLSGFQLIAGVGGAYVFTRTNGAWSQQALLRAPQADQNDAFGGSVAIHADTVVVGARGDDGADNMQPEAGAAYVFTRTGGAWSALITLRAPNAGAEDQFGASVAISGATIAVGAPLEDGGPFTAVYNGGATYIFTNTNGSWSHQSILRASGLDREDQVGEAVSLSGDTLVVGASRDDGVNNGSADAGAAYVFTRTARGWTQHGVLRAPIVGAGDRAGLSVAVSAGMIVVGAPYADAGGGDAGSAYGFGAP